MQPQEVSTRPPAITWHWRFFLLGVVYALPALVVAPFSPVGALGFALGVLPAAAYNLPQYRRGRRIILLVGALSGACLMVGAILTQVPVVAVVGIFVLAVVFALWARARPAGAIGLLLCLPMIAVGLSVPEVSLGAIAAVLCIVGSLYAWGVATLWPTHHITFPVRDSRPTRRETLTYGVLLGGAAATAAAAGYLTGLPHVGWGAVTALIVMRPLHDQLIGRTLRRAAAVLIGALAASVFALFSENTVVAVGGVALAIAALTATQASRWLIAPAFNTFIALTLILQIPDERPFMPLVERVIETGIGLGAALIFGAGIPALIRLARQRGQKGTTP